ASGTSLVWIIGIRYDDGSFATVQQTSSPAVRIGDRFGKLLHCNMRIMKVR
ncbi:MAG: hypothetical protein H6R14_3226, partial [Proteobacteria bacterium]|nr:hypothetical protein [Pseudomonadota bacterium]